MSVYRRLVREACGRGDLFSYQVQIWKVQKDDSLILDENASPQFHRFNLDGRVELASGFFDDPGCVEDFLADVMLGAHSELGQAGSAQSGLFSGTPASATYFHHVFLLPAISEFQDSQAQRVLDDVLPGVVSQVLRDAWTAWGPEKEVD